MANEISINGINYFQLENKLFDKIRVTNSYDISSSVPTGSAFDEQKPEWKIYKDILFASASSTFTDSVTDDVIKQNYLSCYSSTIKKFILAGKESVYLRPFAVTGSNTFNATVSGSNLFNQTPFYDLVDIQQLKEYSSNIFTADPCLLMDSDNINAVIEPIKIAMIKVNFKLLCRTVITMVKLQNIFLTSVFNNEEFYKSGVYYDSTFIDYAFDIMLQKLSLLIPKYKKSIKVMLLQELNKKISDGEEILDPISNETIVFDTPINDDNRDSNIEKYMKVIFKEEVVFVTDKTNTLFNSSGSDPGNLASYYFAPSSTFGTNKLYTAKEYFIESLPVTYYGVSTTEVASNTKLFLELSSSQDLSNNKITTYLNVNHYFTASEESDTANFLVTLFNVSKTNSLSSELTGTELQEFMQARLPQLKQELLTNDMFLLMTNYLFPVNKILNIASLFYINMSLKLYQTLNDITKGSIKAISTIHEAILDNNQDCDTPSPVEFELDDMIMGINLEILKAIALAPIQILKGIEETFDPNIFIATKLRTVAELAGAPKLPIIPYSAPLMIPPPFGFGIMPVAPWGYYYWAVDAAELALLYAKDGFQTNSLPQFNISKDPFKPDC